MQKLPRYKGTFSSGLFMLSQAGKEPVVLQQDKKIWFKLLQRKHTRLFLW